jgi:tryptophanyl-tRNA synthetase
MTDQALQKKPVIYSGIQPSGVLTIGNYIGAIKNFKLLENEYECFYAIVDMHAITLRQNAADLRRRTLELAAMYIASGLDPDKNMIYCQSHVPAHAELAWILSCFTYMGELQRMTQFKEKSAKNEANINAGLFTYPVLMAADILLYQSNLVPVGSDQKQHLELTRDLAIRFNNIYGDVFTVPEAYIGKVGSRVMSLQEPLNKMSKSDPEDTFISMLDKPDDIRRKIKKAVTDNDADIRFDMENKPGVSNLLSIEAALTDKSIEAVTEEFSGKGYGDLKNAVAEAVIGTMLPIQREYEKLMADKAYVQAVLSRNAETVARRAARTLNKVKKKVGYTQPDVKQG